MALDNKDRLEIIKALHGLKSIVAVMHTVKPTGIPELDKNVTENIADVDASVKKLLARLEEDLGGKSDT